MRGSDVTVGLSQSRDVIEVYFDGDEALEADSVQNQNHYKLITIDEATGADGIVEETPTNVVYDAESHKATLTFDPGAIADGVLYRLEVGGAGIIADAAPVAEVGASHDSFASAQDLGVVDQSGLLVTGSINQRVEIEAPGTLPSLFYPSQEGSIDEPGHRNIPIDDASHGLQGITSTAPGNQSGIIRDVRYNFRSDYGTDTQGNQLFNAITEEQRLRVREIFDLFSRYAGIRFIETDADGITVATGDTAVISDNTPRTSVNGLARGSINRVTGEVSADALAIVNSLNDWGESEYGGGFFQEAIRQIGQVLGLWQTYDLPSVMGESLPGENVFPSDYDILHLQQLYPRAGTEIDVYSFTLASSGHFQAETIAERLADGASTLDTVVSVYDANGELVSRNDDSFGRDSRVSLELDAGAYSVVVSSTGNTSYNLEVSNSGYGGFTQGAYDLRLTHTPEATVDNSIEDVTKTILDGDRDGQAGGVFNFHFRTAAEADTIYVDKIATDALESLQQAAVPVQAISTSNVTAGTVIELDDTTGIAAGMIVRLVYQGIGDPAGTTVVPAGTTVVSNDSATQLTLSAPVTFLENTRLQFETVQIEIGDASGVEVGMLVLGDGVPEGTTVVSNDASIIPANANAADFETATADAASVVTAIADVASNEATIIVGDTTGITAGMHVAGVGVPAGTTVLSIDSGTELTLSALVTLAQDTTLEFWTKIVVADTTDITAGMLVKGAGIPSGTTVLSIDSGTELTLSAPVTLAQDTALEFWTNIVVADTFGITAGMVVTGTGVPSGTTVLSIDSGTELTLSAPVTLALSTPLQFWSDHKVTLSSPVEAGVGEKIRFVSDGDGSLANPFLSIADAMDAVNANTEVIRIIGNEGTELTGSTNLGGRPSLQPNALVDTENPYHYYVGFDEQGQALADGNNLIVPAGVTLMIDGGATFRMASANLEVGSSSELVSRAGASVQILGTPSANVAFTSLSNDPTTDPEAIQYPLRNVPKGGDWGGIVLRADSDWQPTGDLDATTLRPVLNNLAHAVISYGGGEVVVNAETETFSAIQIEDTRPTVAFSTVTFSADAAISATPNSFEESNGLAGPVFRGNRLLANSTNGLFLAIETEFGSPLDKLDVSARFASTEVTYVIQENLVLSGGAGSYFVDGDGIVRARPTGRLQIDPGVTVKLKNSRIELERGGAQLIAEGESDRRITFTSFGDVRYGANGEFDTNSDSPNTVAAGDWGGIVLNAGASASIDRALLTYGGGEAPIEGGLDDFNVIEVHQADLRLANSRIEKNATGRAETDRTSRGANDAAAIFVRGAQPIVVGNDFRNNAGALISINANSLIETELGDTGRQVGEINRFEQYDNNHGPLISGNRISDVVGGSDGNNSTGPIVSQFNIDVIYVDQFETTVTTAVEAAVAKWEEIIVGDLSQQGAIDDFEVTIQAGLLGDSDSDGAGGVLANAGPRAQRTASDANPYLPYTGDVGIDMADTGDLQQLTEVMIHELGHALGFVSGVIDDFDYLDANTNFVGSQALAQYQKISPGAQSVPMQVGGSHWDETEFGVEIMTPSWSPNSVVSMLTVGLFDDLGYDVDYSKADPYTTPGGVALTPPGATLANDPIAGVMIRAEEIVVESVWDDTDIVHVVTDEIIVNNFHTATGLRLESDSDASLVVKLDGNNAGFTASGEGADIDDRIGGTVQVVGQPGFPVILTSLADDTVGASVDALGFPVSDTNVDGTATQPAAGNWRGLQFLPLANDRNVMVVNESEAPFVENIDDNNVIISAEVLGILAPNFATDGNTWESAQEKTGDENRRLGFEVHGSIAYDNPADVDIYTFDGSAGSEIWIDVDKTSSSLDTMVELLDASGRVLARSADSQNDSGSITDVTVTAEAGGEATVTGEQATIVGAAAATTGVGAVVDGVDVTVTGVAAQAVGYQSQVIGIGAQAAQASAIDDVDIQLDDATGIHVGAAATLAGAIPGGATVAAVDGNTITLDQALIGNITNEWIEFGISGVSPFSSRRIVFDTTPQDGVWVGLPASANTVQSIQGARIAVLDQEIEVVPDSNTTQVTENFVGPQDWDETGAPTDAATGVQGAGNPFYRLLSGPANSTGRTVSIPDIAPQNWESLTIESQIRIQEAGALPIGEGHSFVLQDTSAPFDMTGAQAEALGGSTNGTDTAINQIGIHFDLFASPGTAPAAPHMSWTWGNDHVAAIDMDDWGDGDWHDVKITVKPSANGQGSVLSVELDDEFIIEDEPLPGYSRGEATRFLVGARAEAAVDGLHDIRNITARSDTPAFTSQTVGNLGLATDVKTIQNLLVDDGTPVLNGATVNGGPTEVDANTTPIDPDNSTIALVELDNTVTVNENQLLTFSLAGGQNVDSQYITVNDVADVQVGAKINGLAGIPDGARVADVDTLTNTIELSVPISNVSLNDVASVGYINGDTITVVDASTLADGMLVSSPNSNNVANGTEIDAGGIDLVLNEVTLTDVFDVADGEFLQFGFLGAAITTDTLFVNDTAVTVGSTVAAADDPTNILTTVASLDAATGAVTLDAPIEITDNELLIFGFNGQPVTASRVVLDPATVDDAAAIVAPVLVNMVGAGVLDQEVPDGTQVATFDSVTSNILELSQPVTVSNADNLGFGFVGTSVVLDDITGIDIGEAVSGPGVPAETTVVNTSNDDGALDPNTIVLSAPINVEDSVDLTFSIQEFSALAAAAVPGVAILPGTLTGVVYDGEQAIQTFTSNRNGTLDFTAVGNPGSRVITGTVDYETGSLSLEFDNPPRDGIELRDVAFEYGNLSLGTLGFAQNNGVWENGAFPLTKDAYRGGDYYTTNPRDAGMRVTLPGTQGTEQKYFVRVRSQPEIGADLAAHETNLTDTSGNGLTAGQTSGSYELRIRTRQRDDKPGSVVTFADIRYPTIGIDVQGLPNNSPLVGTTGEDDSNNDTFANAQETGNLLSSDRNTISTSGRISERNDVDWYEFDLTYEDIQTLTTHNDEAKTFATIFDIDYADGLRGDYGLAVFDANGQLIYVGRDSNITDDQPGAGQANDFDDLSRGSVGALDPFIGSAHLEAGFNDQARTYYVAVSSNGMLPTALDQAYVSAATNPLLRLEPVSSVNRIVEDHIGTTGYATYGPSGADAAGIIEVGNENVAGSSTRLSAHVRPWTLQDMTLYVSAGDSILTTNPFTADGYRVQHDYGDNNRIGDLDMRTDGTLMQYVGINGDANNNGILFSTDWATGDRTQFGADSIANVPNQNFNAQNDWYKNTNDTVDAVAIRRSGVATYNATNANSGAAQAIYYSVRDGGVSLLYSADNSGNADGSEAAPRTHSRGLMGEIESAPGEAVAITGLTTGLQFQNDVGQLFGVSSGGQFYEVNRGTAEATNVVDFSAFLNNGEGFQGLTTGPVNLEGGRFAGRFFAVTNTGRLVCIDPTGADDGTAALVDNVFDTRDAFGNVDGIADSFVSDPTTGVGGGGATGLAFSPLDISLWHPTGLRRGDDGHGVNTTADNSRPADVIGGDSMYFGLETWSASDSNEDYYRYDNNQQFGAQGGVPYNWQQELTANPDIGQNYNLPGGAHGSLVTGTFSLADLSYTDKPTAYISYFLDTQDASSSAAADSMRDAARILGSADGGLTWELLATNNQQRSGFDGAQSAELPPLLTASSAISTAGYDWQGIEFVGNQQVQELFDTASWRQTRIDLGMFAGESAVQLRFDFSTYGDLNQFDRSNIEPEAVRQVAAIDGPGTTVTLNSVEGLAVGMIAQTAADVLLAPGDVSDGVVTITQIDPANSQIVLSGGLTTLEVDQNVDFFSEQAFKNIIRGNARGIGDWGQVFASAAENNHEGFYIDDIIVGTAERGEMVTGAVGNQTAFYSLPEPPIAVVEYPEETLLGEYQLEVRRGTEYLVQPDQTTNSDIVRSPNTAIVGTFHTNDRFVQAPSGPALFLGRPNLNVIDGAELRSFGNGAVTVDGVQAVLASAVDTQLANHSALTWAVDLAGQDSAFLSFNATRGPSETVTSLPDQFTFNAWDPATPADQVVGLPEGDGAALSTDGGFTWTRLADFSWTGGQVVDLAAIDTLTANTRIGFFQSGGTSLANNGGVTISDIAITTAPLAVHSTGTIGDSNNPHELEQGQFIVTSNIISDADTYGIRVNAGRDSIGDAPHAGAVRNLPVLINSRLIPGVVVSNNVIETGVDGTGISYLGTLDGANTPDSARPFGRILNNTIVGDGSGTGINVALNASTTLMNNVFANLGTGVSVDGTSVNDASNEKLTEIDTSAFYLVGTEVSGAAQKNGITLTESPFVDIANGNFYPTSPTKIVDSAMDAIIDRQPSIVEKAAIGISQSPIETPNADLYGQRRADDPDQATDVGFGGDEVFKDRGAIERVDRSAPTARLITPLDQGSFGELVDEDNDLDEVLLQGREARGVQQFVIQISDVGVGVDKSSIVTAAVEVSRNGVALVDGVDYFFQFNANTNQIILSSLVVYELGDYTIELRPDAQQGLLQDLAGNALFSNAEDSNGRHTSFIVELTDVPSVPSMLTAVAGDDKVMLDWNASTTSPSSPVQKYFIEYSDSVDGGENWGAWSIDSVDASTKADGAIELPVVDNTLRRYRVFAQNVVGLGPKTEPVLATPSAPLNVTGVIGLENAVQAGQVSLDWDVPVNHGGFVPTHYVVDRIAQSDSILPSSAGSRAALSADGLTFAYFSTSDELKIYDTSTTTVPVLLGSWSTASAGKDVLFSADGSLAYVIQDNGLSIIEITDPSAIAVKGAWLGASGAGAAALTVAGDYVILNTGEVINVADADQPTYEGSIGDTWIAAEVVGNQLFTISGVNELKIYDISNPASPTFVSTYVTNGTARDLAVVGTSLYVADDTNGLVVLDVTDPAIPVLNSEVNVSAAAEKVVVKQQKAYISSSDGTLSIYDVSDATDIDTIDKRLVNGRSDLLISDNGSVLIAVGESSDASVYIVDTAASWTRINETPVDTAVVVESLIKGVPQYFRVAAVNESGQGAWSEYSSLLVPEGVPDAPVNFTATINQTDGSISLAWEAPLYDGGEAITSYTIAYQEGDNVAEIPNLDSATLAHNLGDLGVNLNRGTTYQFKVKARNAYGGEDWSTEVTLTTPDVPQTAPAIPTVTAGANSVIVSWIAVPDGSLPISGYVIQRTLDNGVTWVTVSDSDGNLDDMSATVTGLLRADGPHRFRVAGDNDLAGITDEELNYSLPSNPITPFALASEVQSLTGVPGDSIVNLSWTAPADNGGTPVTDYTVEYQLTGDTQWTVYADAQTVLTGASVAGLINGNSYDFRVSAVTELGPGISEVITAITPVGAPLAPAAPVATPGVNSMTLSWVAPADGGSPITGYEISYRTVDSAWTVEQHEALTPSLTLSGLNVAEYIFKVAAKNINGTGAYSPEVFATPYGAPGQPTNIEFIADQTGVLQSLGWVASASNSPDVPSYSVKYRLVGETAWVPLADANNTDQVINLAALNLGAVSYEFQIIATTLSGSSTPLQFTTLSNLQANEANRSVELSWTTPANLSVDDFLIESQDVTNNAVGPWVTFDDGESPASNATVTDLVNGNEYQFRVSAVLLSGTGVSMVIGPVTPAGTPSRPNNLQYGYNAEAGAIVVTWEAPANENGAVITDYRIEYQTQNSDWITVDEGVSAALEATLTSQQVPVGVEIQIRVAAVNEIGAGLAIEGETSVVLQGSPAAPTGLTATALQNGSISLSWNAPSNTGGLSISDYLVEYKSATGTWLPYEDGLSVSTTASITGLSVAGGPYQFRVSAQNAVGTSDVSAVSNAVTPVATADAVEELSIDLGDSTATLSWQPPESNGGAAVTGYQIDYKLSSETAWTAHLTAASSVLSTTISVTNGVEYDYRVTAITGAGLGEPSVLSGHMSVGTPSAPTGLQVSSGSSSQAFLSWQAPADTGGGDITNYVVQYRLQNLASPAAWTTSSIYTTGTTAQVSGLITGSIYEFRVATQNASGTSPYGAIESITVGPTLAAPPAVFAWKASGQVHLGWDRVTAVPEGVSLEHYLIQYRLVGTDSWINLGTDTDNRATFPGLPSGTYQFRVAAVANTGIGAYRISQQTVSF